MRSDIQIATLVVLAVFAGVTICGVGESASVAAVMFTAHVAILTVLIIWGFVYGVQNEMSIFSANMYAPFPAVVTTSGTLLAKHNAGAAIYFGYCSALLGEHVYFC